MGFQENPGSRGYAWFRLNVKSDYLFPRKTAQEWNPFSSLPRPQPALKLSPETAKDFSTGPNPNYSKLCTDRINNLYMSQVLPLRHQRRLKQLFMVEYIRTIVII